MQRSITPQKSHGRGGIKHGFWQAEVMKVTASANDPYKIFIKIDRLGVGVNDPVPADYVGSPPRVGDLLWATFVENNHDEYLIFNTQHQVSDDMSEGVVRFGGQTEQYGVTLKIDPTEYSGSNRATIQMHQTIMGSGSVVTDVGDWYVFDKNANKYNLHHTGHSDTTAGGLTIRATGLSERYIGLNPAYVSGGNEWSAFFMDNALGATLFNTQPYTYTHHPYADNQYDLGSGYRWQDIHLVNQPTVTSDQNEKTDIADSDLGLDFINALRPVSFKWIDRGGGEAGVRTHYGLLGQEVESVLGAAASDTAIWTKKTIEAEPEMPADEHLPGRPAVEEHDRQGLRYTELISPMIKAIQELTARVATLEAS